MRVADIVRTWARERPEHEALVWPGGRYTWAELDARSNRLAQALRGRGVGPGTGAPEVLVTGAERDAWVDGHPAEDPDTPPTGDDVVVQMYTSGTTGEAKGRGADQRQSWRRASSPGTRSWACPRRMCAACPAAPVHIGGHTWTLVGHL